MAYFWIALGSALGGMARYACSGLVAGLFGETFPWGTLLVNVVGSAIIGVVAALALPEGRLLVPSEARLFIMVGFCGGFTTFSSFSLQTLSLLQDGQWVGAFLNVALSVMLCMAAVWTGFAATVAVTR